MAQPKRLVNGINRRQCIQPGSNVSWPAGDYGDLYRGEHSILYDLGICRAEDQPDFKECCTRTGV